MGPGSLIEYLTGFDLADSAEQMSGIYNFECLTKSDEQKQDLKFKSHSVARFNHENSTFSIQLSYRCVFSICSTTSTTSWRPNSLISSEMCAQNGNLEDRTELIR